MTRTRTPDPYEAAHNRSYQELRNKISRTCYAIVDYHLMSREYVPTAEELEGLVHAAFKAIYQGAGYSMEKKS